MCMYVCVCVCVRAARLSLSEAWVVESFAPAKNTEIAPPSFPGEPFGAAQLTQRLEVGTNLW